jgi:hypothetical protein
MIAPSSAQDRASMRFKVFEVTRGSERPLHDAT